MIRGLWFWLWFGGSGQAPAVQTNRLVLTVKIARRVPFTVTHHARMALGVVHTQRMLLPPG